MKRRVLATAIALAGCGGAPPLPPPPKAPAPIPWPAPTVAPERARATPDAPFRERAPEPSGAVAFVPPKVEAFALKNGTKVLLVERHELPIVSVMLVVKSGAGESAERPGVMSFMGTMLEQGTAKRSALQISDEYEALGATHTTGVWWDSGGVSVKVLASRLDAALDVMSDVALHPSFPEAEIERLRARRLTGLVQEKNSPSTMAWNAASAVVYGRTHPYGHSLSGREADVKAITRAELVRAYERTFVPGAAAIVVAGDVTKEALVGKLEAAFGAWNGKPVARAKVPAVPAQKGESRLVLVDKPKAPQSMVVLAEPGVAWSTPDRDALAVMNTILGGQFSSRINLNLREAHAYTYGAGSRFQMRHGPGPFSASGAIVHDKTAAAVGELFKELDAIRDHEVSAEELADAKDALKLAMPGRFETVTAVTDALSDLFVYDLPLDEYATRPARIDAVTAAEVKRVALAHVHPRLLRVVIVGDKGTLEPQLETLHLGAAEVRDTYGDPVRP
jgi:predicted Zn-dependent peptidase